MLIKRRAAMWTSTLSLEPSRVVITRLLGRVWRGAYFTSFAPLRVENLPRQTLPASNWVRVRNTLAGISGSDLQLVFANIDPRVAIAALPEYGRIAPGREVVGEVIEVGEDVRQLHVGDRVALQYPFNCRAAGVHPVCRSCASGNYALCEQISFPDRSQPAAAGAKSCWYRSSSSSACLPASTMSRPSCWSLPPSPCTPFYAACPCRGSAC